MVRLAARSTSDSKRVRYLLGQSSPAEREDIESEYFEDEDAFQEMLIAEDDLIDSYVRGELTAEERRSFGKSVVSSLHGRDRVQFARAFAGVVSATPSNQTKLSYKSLETFKAFLSPRLLQTATIAALVVFVVMLAWLLIDRRRMTNDLRELRADSAELSKRTEELQRTSDVERTRTAELAAQLETLRARRDMRRSERETIASERARHRPEVNNDRGKVIDSKPGRVLQIIKEDASLGSNFVNQTITQLPLEARNVPGLLTLPTAATLDGVFAGAMPNTFVLMPQTTNRRRETTIFIPPSFTWLRFRITLETAATHEDYRILINTMNSRRVASVDWIEPLTPNQTIVDTPIFSTGDLPSGDYVLSLMGKERDGSFVIVAECSFKVMREQ